MNRFGMIVVAMALLSISALAQDGPRELVGRDDAVDQTQAQLQRNITEVYLSNFKERVGLTDEQLLNVAPIIRTFVERRFRVANQRRRLTERQDQLLSQPNPSETEIRRLNEELTRLEESAALDARLMRNLQPELSERQLLAAHAFHRNFVNNQLPRAVERLRANAAPRGQQQQRTAPAARGNNPQNRREPAQPTRPANTLRGRQAPSR